jgi:hypothetical protein
MGTSATFNFSQGKVVSHESLIRPPIADKSLTANQKTVQDVADVLGVPPVDLGRDYLAKCVRVAALLGVPSQSAEDALRSEELSSNIDSQIISVQRPLPGNPLSEHDHVAVRNAALSARNNVFSFVNKANASAAFAAAGGFFPQENPFVVISNLEATRRRRAATVGNSGLGINIDVSAADRLVSDIVSFVSAVGTPVPDDRVSQTAQLNGFTLSLDGFGSGGNVATDMMRFLPSADEVRIQKESDLLAAFDFRRRVPRVLFTADYDPAGDQPGMLVCWKRIPDASGYVINRRNVFDNTERKVQVSNADLQSAMDHLRDYLKAYLLTFYDTVDDTQAWAYVDRDTSPDQYYLYRVTAYQVQNDAKNQIFGVQTNPSTLSSANQSRLTTTLSDLARQQLGQTAGADDVNPWPLVSTQIYGNGQFDWILAAVNSRASVNRNDSPADTRSFSYLGARLSHLLTFMGQGRFVVPKDVSAVVKSVNDSVSSFGVSQTIAEVLHETGILYYFEGTEQKRPGGLDKSNSPQASSVLLSGIIAAIDPETATLDLRSLTTNLQQSLRTAPRQIFSTNPTGLRLGILSQPADPHAVSQELSVPDLSVSDSQAAQGDVQYMNQIPLTENSVIDLTRFDGISSLVRTIRLFADQGANLSSPQNMGTVIPPSRASGSFIPPPAVGRSVFGAPSRVSGVPVSPPSGRRETGSAAPPLVVVRRTTQQ